MKQLVQVKIKPCLASVQFMLKSMPTHPDTTIQESVQNSCMPDPQVMSNVCGPRATSPYYDSVQKI